TLIASACGASIEARYELAQSLAAYLLLVGSELTMEHNRSLWMAFSSFRSLTFLNRLAFCPDFHDDPKARSNAPDSPDILPEFASIRVSTPPHQKPIRT